MEIVDKNGKKTLEKLAEKPKEHNMGIHYRMEIVKTDGKNALIYGWETGYPGGCDCVNTPEGKIYAPKGFGKGEIVYVDIKDKMVEVSKRDNSSLEKFLDNLDIADIDDSISKLQGFTLMGEIRF